MRIDAHQHFWRIADRQGHWPPAELAAIHRDFSAADLQPWLQRGRIDGTVLVQTLPSAADTDYMLGLADANDFIRGVVGWVDMKSADAATQIKRRAQHPRFKGLRPMLQDLPDDHWIDDPALDAAVHALVENGLCFDALVLPRHLGALHRFASRYPSLRIVIDHAAKPRIASAEMQPWQSDMARLAALPNLFCKMSGLLTEAGEGAGRESLQPYVQALWNLFGAKRLMWGSDWPVLRLAADYEHWLRMSEALLDSLQPTASPADRAAIFGGNAARFYRLDADLS
jgi:L-fuconolactonase